MVDTALVLRKLAALEAYRNQIAEYAGIALDAYRSDWKVQRIVERTLQIMIETCADIAGHVIADEGLRAADSYADTFRVLGEQQILSPDLTPCHGEDGQVPQYRGAPIRGGGCGDRYADP